MEEQPPFEHSQNEAQAAQQGWRSGFAKRLGRILMVSVLGSVLYALVVGPRNMRGFADGLFLAGAVLLVIALFPLVGEIFGRTTVPFRLEGRSLDDVLAEERARSQRGGTITYLFGISGIIVVALSFIIVVFV
jgi:hypothetical protein